MAISEVTVSELVAGALAAGWSFVRLQELRAFLSSFRVLDLTPEIRRRAQDLDPEGGNDSLIAATALIYNIPIVSNDDDFLVWEALGLKLRRLSR